MTDGGCPLCQPGWREEKAMYRGRGWRVVPHPTPAPGTQRHLVVFPEQHVTDLLDLPRWVQVSVWDVLSWVRGAYKLDHYGLVTRGGDPGLTGATLVHAHMEVLVGAVDEPGHRGVRAVLSRPAEATAA